MKARPADFRGTLMGKQIVMFFEKPSLRTRLTFEAGIASLGRVSFFVDQTQSRLGARESLSDIAHNLERWVDGVVLRTFSHETVKAMASHASIPVDQCAQRARTSLPGAWRTCLPCRNSSEICTECN